MIDLPDARAGYEKAGEGRAQLGFLKRDYPSLDVEELTVSKSKRERAIRTANAAKARRVRVPGFKTSWGPEFKRQVTNFTGFANSPVPDDIPDAFNHAFNLASLNPPPNPSLVGDERSLRIRTGF